MGRIIQVIGDIFNLSIYFLLQIRYLILLILLCVSYYYIGEYYFNY